MTGRRTLGSSGQFHREQPSHTDANPGCVIRADHSGCFCTPIVSMKGCFCHLHRAAPPPAAARWSPPQTPAPLPTSPWRRVRVHQNGPRSMVNTLLFSETPHQGAGLENRGQRVRKKTENYVGQPSSVRTQIGNIPVHQHRVTPTTQEHKLLDGVSVLGIDWTKKNTLLGIHRPLHPSSSAPRMPSSAYSAAAAGRRKLLRGASRR